MVAICHRVVPHWGAPVREGLANFQGEDIFQAETLGQYKPDTQTLRQSYSQGILATCFASESPWQHRLQEITVSWPRSVQGHLQQDSISSTKQTWSASRNRLLLEKSRRQRCPSHALDWKKAPCWLLAAGCRLPAALPCADRQSSLSPLDR